MKLVGVMSTAVLSFTLAVAAPAYALQEQHDQQEEQKAKPAEQGEKKAQPEKPAKQEQKPAAQAQKPAAQGQKPSAQQEKKTKPEEKNTRQPVKNTKPEQKSAQQQQQPAQPGPSKQQQRAANRIPDDRFKANFGQQHRFRVSQADYGRDRRFQYGGYSFGFVDPWPSNWLYTQDVYVVEINGIYYLCNPMYPGVNIALSVTL